MEISLNESILKEAADWLATRDHTLAAVLQAYGYPPLWDREPGFATLIYIILEQQVSLASARAAFLRLQDYLGSITPDNFLKINDEDLFRIGFSRQKKTYARGLAEAILKQDFAIESLPQMPDTTLRPYMKSLKGIGDWTVDVYALMCLLRPDVLPKGDIALYESFRVLYALDARPNYTFFEENTQHWRPWRSVGARILWHFYLCERAVK
ncbi:MAG: DNA-3-methyladenine glycosylase 2 family protein [Phycisphaerae bacterium]|nr:DNA-3-methyladenine glycosylase 2 family protein [Saprospiraceae bacterium]